VSQAVALPKCTQIILRSLLGSLNPKAETPQQGFLHPQRSPMPPAFAIKIVQRELLLDKIWS